MASAVKYLFLAIISLSFAAFFDSGESRKRMARATSISQSDLLSGEGAPKSGRVEPRFKPSRKSDRIERVVIPGSADGPIVLLPDGIVPACLHPALPSPKFLTGVFNRYRPRDPTRS